MAHTLWDDGAKACDALTTPAGTFQWQQQPVRLLGCSMQRRLNSSLVCPLAFLLAPTRTPFAAAYTLRCLRLL